jgi:hypothetical protein
MPGITPPTAGNFSINPPVGNAIRRPAVRNFGNRRDQDTVAIDPDHHDLIAAGRDLSGAKLRALPNVKLVENNERIQYWIDAISGKSHSPQQPQTSIKILTTLLQRFVWDAKVAEAEQLLMFSGRSEVILKQNQNGTVMFFDAKLNSNTIKSAQYTNIDAQFTEDIIGALYGPKKLQALLDRTEQGQADFIKGIAARPFLDVDSFSGTTPAQTLALCVSEQGMRREQPDESAIAQDWVGLDPALHAESLFQRRLSRQSESGMVSDNGSVDDDRQSIGSRSSSIHSSLSAPDQRESLVDAESILYSEPGVPLIDHTIADNIDNLLETQFKCEVRTAPGLRSVLAEAMFRSEFSLQANHKRQLELNQLMSTLQSEQSQPIADLAAQGHIRALQDEIDARHNAENLAAAMRRTEDQFHAKLSALLDQLPTVVREKTGDEISERQELLAMADRLPNTVRDNKTEMTCASARVLYDNLCLEYGRIAVNMDLIKSVIIPDGPNHVVETDRPVNIDRVSDSHPEDDSPCIELHCSVDATTPTAATLLDMNSVYHPASTPPSTESGVVQSNMDTISIHDVPMTPERTRRQLQAEAPTPFSLVQGDEIPESLITKS